MDTKPAWILVMRHAKAIPDEARSGASWPRQVPGIDHPKAVLAEAGLEEAGQVGHALARTLDDFGRAGTTIVVGKVLYEDSAVARATAEALAAAFERTAAKRREVNRVAPTDDAEARDPVSEGFAGPDSLGSRIAVGREFPALTANPSNWLKKTYKAVVEGDLGSGSQRESSEPGKESAEPSAEPGKESAVLLVGHDPGMSLLVAHLLKQGRGWSRRGIPSLARSELIALHRKGKRWQPLWALTPHAKGDTAFEKDVDAITTKIKSKMDTAKVFGAFLTALIVFVAGEFGRAPLPSSAAWAVIRGVSLAALGVAAVLYFTTLFWYDRLLMPVRFWGAPDGRSHKTVVVWRPPSSAVWVLYQNMQRTWRLLFVPATYLTGVGVAAFAAARIEPSSGWAAVMVGLVAVLVAASGVWAWVSRPVLGVQD